MTARISARSFTTGWLCCLLIASAYVLCPASAFGAFVPSTQDSLALTNTFALGSEAFPEAIALGPSSTIYYTHSDRNRPFELGPDPSTYIVGLTGDGAEMFRVGQEYASELRRPAGMDFSSDGLLVIADSENNRIRVLNPTTGQFVYTFGEVEFGDGQFAIPSDVVVAADDTLWIADTYHSKIQHTALWGGSIGEFSLPAGERPDGIALDAAGNLWIAVPSHNKVVQYSPEGQLLATIDGWTETDEDGEPVGTDSFLEPRAIGVDPWGVLYVGDTGNGRIVRLSPDGTWLGSLNPSGALVEVSDIDIDAFGNVFAADPATDVIYRFQFVMAGDDTEPPITASNIPTTWQNTPLVVTLNAADSANAILGTWYSIDGSFPTLPYTGPFTISDPGVTTVKYYSVDEAQNYESVKTRPVRLDYVKPGTISDVQTAYGTTAVINFTASDDLSGVSRTEYSFNGGSWKTGSTFTTSVGGSHTLRYRSVDLAGNLEDISTVQFTVTPRVDQSASGIYYEGTWTRYNSANRVGGFWLATNEPRAHAYFSFEGQGFTLISSRGPTFGIAKITIDGESVHYADLYGPATLHRQPVLAVSGLADATHTVKIEWTGTRNPASTGTAIGLDALDVGGELLVDTEPPVTTVDGVPPGWANNPLLIRLTAEDEGTWVTHTYYSVNGGPTRLYSEPFMLDSDGVQAITFWSVDKAGNVEPPTMTTAFTDWTPPTTSSNIPADWVRTDVDVVLTASDSVAGVEDTYYSINNLIIDTLYDTPFTVDSEGTTVVRYLSVDVLGNEESLVTEHVRIDKTAPVSTIVPSSSGWSNRMTIAIEGDDPLSGVANIRYRIGGDDFSVYTEPLVVAEEGTHEVQCYATDNAGNVEETRSLTVYVDSTPPNLTSNAVQSYLAPSTITAFATDDGSGVERVEYRIDGGDWIEGASIPTGASGAHVVDIRAWDHAGNATTESLEYEVLTRFEQTDPRIVYEGLGWATADNVARSGGSWSFTKSGPASAHVTFTGNRIDLIASKGPTYGIARVSIDGVPVRMVDLYAPNYPHKQRVFSATGLSAGQHVLTLEWTGTQNPAATGSTIGLDAVDVRSVAQTILRYEDDRAEWARTGSWSFVPASGRSGASFSYTSAADGAAYARVRGTGFDLVSSKMPDYGIARVVVNGGTPVLVDLYAAKSQHQQKVCSIRGLPYGVHEVEVKWTGTKNPLSAGTRINVDAIDVEGSLLQAAAPAVVMKRYESDSSLVAYTGAWTAGTASGRSATSWTYADAPGGVAHISFRGDSVRLLATQAPVLGLARIILNDREPVLVDLYAAKYLNQQVVFSATGLGEGDHKMTVEWVGEKRVASSGTRINLDAIEVSGTLLQATAPTIPKVRFENTEPAINYGGQWVSGVASGRSDSTWSYADNDGSVTTFTFEGTAVDIVGTKAPTYGIARIVLDGTQETLVDLYATKHLHQQILYAKSGLSEGEHTLTIEWTGQKNAASTGTRINIDAVDLAGTLVPSR